MLLVDQRPYTYHDIIIRDSNGIEIEIISLNDKIKNNPEKNKLNSV